MFVKGKPRWRVEENKESGRGRGKRGKEMRDKKLRKGGKTRGEKKKGGLKIDGECLPCVMVRHTGVQQGVAWGQLEETIAIAPIRLVDGGGRGREKTKWK